MSIRYVVLCTGSEKENREIAQDLERWFREHGVSPAMAQCTRSGVVYTRTPAAGVQHQDIYGSNVLDVDYMDRMAMVINQMYCADSGRTARENWLRCDYFSKMSSRASADFYPAMIRASGMTEEQIRAGNWPPKPEQLENLAITEHMRWCAFHIVMGFQPMENEEFDRRAARYREEVRRTGASSLRIGKDMTGRRHACLVGWDRLDELSEKENAITGGHVDYKQMDRSNVLALPQILKARDELECKGGRTA